jgi:virginiamycin B lyase
MDRRSFLAVAAVSGAAFAAPAIIQRRAEANTGERRVRYFQATAGSRSRDVACSLTAPHVWYCGQGNGTLNRLDPLDGSIHEVNLGQGAAPHGAIFGPDGALWVTEGGQNAIARVDPTNFKVDLFRLPADKARANLNTGEFDKRGTYWFTGQNGIYGKLDPRTGAMQVWDAPRGRGPYGITVTPQGTVWYVSLAGNHLANIDIDTGQVTIVEPPTPGQGARRVWSDSRGKLWISEWNSGNVSVYDPGNRTWRVWKLPGERPRAYSVYVDERDMVWLTDFSANAIVMFDPTTERFTSYPSDRANANVRQMAGRPGEAWGGESGTNRLVMIDSRPA